MVTARTGVQSRSSTSTQKRRSFHKQTTFIQNMVKVTQFTLGLWSLSQYNQLMKSHSSRSSHTGNKQLHICPMFSLNTICLAVIGAPSSNTWVLPWVHNPLYICLAARWVSNWILGMLFATTTRGQVDTWHVVTLPTVWCSMFTVLWQTSYTFYNSCAHAAASTQHCYNPLILAIILLHMHCLGLQEFNAGMGTNE